MDLRNDGSNEQKTDDWMNTGIVHKFYIYTMYIIKGSVW